MKLDKLTTTSLKEHVIRALRKSILQGTLRPGTRIVEQVVAEELGISRGPVREALLQLEAEGLLVIHPRRGAEVTKLSAQDAWEIYTLRANLETFALRLAMTKYTKEDFRAMNDIVSRMTRYVKENDVNALLDADLRFHNLLVGRSQHKRLAQNHQTLDPLMGAIFYTSIYDANIMLENMPARHQSIVNTLQDGDVTQAIQAVSEHYVGPANSIIRASQSGDA